MKILDILSLIVSSIAVIYSIFSLRISINRKKKIQDMIKNNYELKELFIRNIKNNTTNINQEIASATAQSIYITLTNKIEKDKYINDKFLRETLSNIKYLKELEI